MTQISGKTAFITGGASGIGLGMAGAFKDKGAKLIVADIRDDHLEAAKQKLGEKDNLFIKLDVTDREAWGKAADQAEEKFGQVDILCNNAGVGPFGDATIVSYDDWDWCNKVNYGGTINGVQTFLKRLLANKDGGHIMNTTSVGGILPMAGGIAYISSKFAVTGLTEALRADLMGKNVKVTLLIPGPVASNIHQVAVLRPDDYKNSQVGEMEKEMMDRQHLESWMSPETAGKLIADGVERNLPYITTHGQFKKGTKQFFDSVLAYFSDLSEAEQNTNLGFDPINPAYGEILANLQPPAKP